MKTYNVLNKNRWIRTSVHKDYDENGKVTYVERRYRCSYTSDITSYHGITAGRAKRIARNHRERISPHRCGMKFRKMKFKGSWPNAVIFTYDSRSRKLVIRVGYSQKTFIGEKEIDKPEGFR